MSDHDILDLIDRAAIDAPHMHVSASHVVAGGRRKVRRRRVVSAGVATGGLALAGLTWLALGSGSGLTTAPGLEPAGQVWRDDQAVDSGLFLGYQTIDSDQTSHRYDARMIREVAGGPVVLELSDRGSVVEKIPAQSSVPGLDVYAGERMTVAVWVQPDGTMSSVPLVGPYDEGGTSGAGSTVVDDRSLGYAVWPADVMTPPKEIRDVYLMGDDEVVTLSGAEVDTKVLNVAGDDSLFFYDAARGVFGGDERGVFGPFLFDPVSEASVFSINAGAADGTVRVLAVLPTGADHVRTSPSADVGGDAPEVAQATLGGRTVLATVAQKSTSPVDGSSPVFFDLSGQQYDVDSYNSDLFTLDVEGGELMPQTDPLDGTALILADQQDQEVVRLTRDELDQGLVITDSGSSVVIAAQGFDPGSELFSKTRIQLLEGGEGGTTRWVVPVDVAQAIAPWGEPVTFLTLQLSGEESVRAVGVGEGEDIQAWTPTLFDGIAIEAADGAFRPMIDGIALAPAAGTDLGGPSVYAYPDGSAGLILVPGQERDAEVVPIQRQGGSATLAPGLIEASAAVLTEQGPVLVLKVAAVTPADPIVALAVRPASALIDNAVNDWILLPTSVGSSPISTTHVALDPKVVVTITDDLWLLAPTPGSRPDTEPIIGIVDRSLLTSTREGGRTVDLYAVLSTDAAGPTPQLVLADGAVVLDAVVQTLDIGRVWQGAVRLPEDKSLGDLVQGLDLDADGRVNIPLSRP
ncbi:MAG: hypothetical protein Q4P07_11380 [Ornithinimicrobium sp.]|uniref:hypothetical protein n=1 Tax=Ornithinimicrobium sp. TaxID=1977084 RepID=UPI0026DEF21B|nr:hypothetical protein [Ornithinimicrobium sp.]MDO5740736.1 hypothetical protein [Ornithinimicrobium sp.]